MKKALLIFSLIFAYSCSNPRQAKTPSHSVLSEIFAHNILEPNITYYKSESTELKLDLWLPAKRLGVQPWVEYLTKPKPVLLNIHGGKWISGDKVGDTYDMMHYINKGWAVVNINYRFVNDAPLPAPILDCRRALHWIYTQANKYGFDTDKIVVSGSSSGGHYALMTGLLNSNDDRTIFNFEHDINLKVHSIINWYGMYDLGQVSDWNGKNIDWETKEFLTVLTGGVKNSQHVLNTSSPSSYLSKNAPNIITIHGDSDPIAPYTQSVNLHNALDRLGVKNKLVTIQEGKHHNFSTEDLKDAYDEIFNFITYSKK